VPISPSGRGAESLVPLVLVIQIWENLIENIAYENSFGILLIRCMALFLYLAFI
jgi:hypothetical protein